MVMETFILMIQWYFLIHMMLFDCWNNYALAVLYNYKKAVSHTIKEAIREREQSQKKEVAAIHSVPQAGVTQQQNTEQETEEMKAISRQAWINAQRKLYPERYPEGVDLSMTYEERMEKEKNEQEVAKWMKYLDNNKKITNSDLPKDLALLSIQNTLNRMVGLTEVKTFIAELNDLIEVNRMRREKGLSQSKPTLHMIFTGNPGTGKTTVARLVADMLKALGIVSKGHLVEVTREDLVEGYIGQTAVKTKKVLERASGGVLFIDEAYTLSRGGDQDFGREAIDTIVKHMEDHREDLVVILAGYSKEMEDFMKINSGLRSRFPLQVEFADYSAEELLVILKTELKKREFTINAAAEKHILADLETKTIKGRSDSGNGRMIRNMIEDAVRRQSSRLRKKGSYLSKEQLKELTLEDFNIQETSLFDLEKTLADIIGNEPIKEQIRMMAAQMKIEKLRAAEGFKTSSVSRHMVFSGNPGSGKTMIARTMADLLKEIGVLKKGHLVEVSREDLVAGYVGQTALKTKEIVESALGGVLFIDEAYSLSTGGENDFGREAISTLVKMMEDHREELVVILAGYPNEMDGFFQTNAGLRSRFPNHFHFEDYSPLEMTKILEKLATLKGYVISPDTLKQMHVYLSEYPLDVESGNGRFCRNVLEEAIKHQAYRLSELGRIPTKQELSVLEIQDFSILHSVVA